MSTSSTNVFEIHLMSRFFKSYAILITFFCTTFFSISQEAFQVSPFLPEIISKFPNVRDFTISNQEDEAYFTAQDVSTKLSVIVGITKNNTGWDGIDVAPFSGKYKDLEPFLAPDGLRLYFVSNRPKNDKDTLADFDIWYVERDKKSTSWSQPINVGAPVNSDYDEYYPAITNTGNLYFTIAIPNSGTQDDLYVAQWSGKKYLKPVKIEGAVNTNGAEYNAYISPDESFMIFGGWQRDGNQGGGDLYLSKRDAAGLWNAPIHLKSPINSKFIDYCPFVNTANNTLYFTSRRSSILNNGPYLTIEALYKALDQQENGSSRIYKTSLESLLKI